MDYYELLELARAAFAAGEFQVALGHARALVEGSRQAPEALVMLVNAATRAGAMDEAIAGLERLLERFPENEQFRRMLSTAVNNRAARLPGDADIARAEYERALALWPQNPDAAYNLGRAELRAGRMEPALRNLRHASALAPADAGIARALAECEFEAARHLAENGELFAARAAFARAAMRGGRGATAPSLRACIGERLALPGVYDSDAELGLRRREFAYGLERLTEEFDAARLAGCARGLEQIAWSNFLLAYQGEDDLELQARYGDWLAGAALRLAHPFAGAAAPARRGGRRVGFLSSFFRASTVGSYFSSWIAALTRAGFETVVFQLGPLHDQETMRLEGIAGRVVRLDQPLADVAAVVREARLDLLVFPELGMDARVFALAALRLAPRQAMAWGHPVTSGLPTVDAFLGSAAMEPPDGGSHYRERWIGLPGLGTRYELPGMPPPAGRGALGLPAGRLYLVPQAAFKIHPDNDAVHAAIAAGDSGGTLVLFENERPGMTTRLRARLERAMRAAGADPTRQLLFLPMCDRTTYLAINRACDVMVDTLHWSGGNTSLDAFACGLPVVTAPGRFMRGRQTAAMLERMALADSLVVEGPQALACRALALAGNPEEASGMRRAILAGREELFRGEDALAALVQAVRELLDQPATEA